MSIVLFGASPWGTRALTRLEVDYHLVVSPDESLSSLHGRPATITRVPFVEEPESALAVPCSADVRAALSFTEPGLLPAALIADRHGLAGTSVAAVAATRNKLAMRRLLQGVVTQPRFGLVGVDLVPADLDAVMVKPLSGTAGLGVSLVPIPEMGRTPGGLLWEEHVVGWEVSVETVSRTIGNRTRTEVVGITDKTTSGPPDFVEVAHSAPSCLGRRDRAAVLALVLDALDHLGVHCGAAHTEVVVSGQRGPVLIEMQTRPGGGRIPSLHEVVSGVDHYEAAIRAVLDLPPGASTAGARTATARMILTAPTSTGGWPGSSPTVRRIPPETEAALVDVELWPAARLRPDLGRSNLNRHGVVVAGGNDQDAVDRVIGQAVSGLMSSETRHEEVPA